ncbi:hypothetical protein BDN72DRAFT_151690 [Pluteus cervinus]|uniref:Uncharacterized protein n=1 Tax=Pluteus cervinus TaxID=181527 RepID=A0ACD3B7F6_9AGAR|nr:hypothetical protein BDN72DRAFT_151690 [Pluteus cervinus]
MSHPSVLIVGAGSAGLVLALSLLKHGIPVRIIEKDASYRPGQRGVAVQPRSLEIHGLLGTLDDFQAQGKESTPMTFYGPDGKTVVRIFEMAIRKDPTPSYPIPNAIILGQVDQETIFRSHIENLGCNVELSTELTSYSQTEDGVVAHIVKHVDGKKVEETIKYDYLVGADGGHSTVRKHLGVTFLGETRLAENMTIGDVYVEADESQLDRKAWHIWGDPTSKMMSLRPASRDPNVFTIVALGVGYDHARVASSREAFVEEFYEVSGRRDIKFGKMLWLNTWRANIRMVDRFSAGRVFLVGDAAHCHSPTGGQGANSSIQDSFNLAWKLALVIQGHAKPSLLDSFGEERLPIITEMLNRTTRLLDSAFEGFKNVPKDPEQSPWRRGGDLRQLGINYRKSPIVVEDGSGPAVTEYQAYQASADIHAGDRAPDAPDLALLRGATGPEVETRLYKLFGTTYHTALIFFSAEEDLPNFVAPFTLNKALFKTVLVLPESLSWAKYPEAIDVVVHDQCGHAFKGYEVDKSRTTVVIVRPDAYIGAIVHNVEGIQKYLERVLG